MIRLAGTYHPIPYLLSRLPDFLPGVTEFHGIWADTDGELHTTCSSQLEREKQRLFLQKWRRKSKGAFWLDHFYPFDAPEHSTDQLSFDDETKLNTLVLTFPSVHDKLRDVVAIEFPQHIFLKSINAAFSGISTQEKKVLQNLLSSILHAEHERVSDERTIVGGIAAQHSEQKTQIADYEERLATSERLYSSAIRSILKEFIEPYEREMERSIIIHDELVHYFAKQQLSIDRIKTYLEKMVTVAYHVNLESEQIELTKAFAAALIKDTPNPPRQSTPDLRETDKVIALLDRYETAANRVEKQGGILNAKNIARSLETPVTPPAITDAVKKNKSKIGYYLKQFPDRWSLIRQHIRPIERLDDTSQGTFLRQSS
ncbi:MAG: hypothetical protein ACQERC_01635 [Bacteroidota bacterium]